MEIIKQKKVICDCGSTSFEVNVVLRDTGRSFYYAPGMECKCSACGKMQYVYIVQAIPFDSEIKVSDKNA